MRIALAAMVAAATLVARMWAAEPLPPRLSETGLYLPGTRTVDPQNRPFAPQYPLWSDGAEKSRWVRLPPGTQVDARDVDNWVFPVGTRFWKEFTFAGRKVETRMLWRSSPDAWSYAAYAWNDAQTDATLASADGIPNVAEVAPGKRHGIPSREDCKACHENGRTPVLGFTALQLSTDRDPGAPHAQPLEAGMMTLKTLMDERLLDPPHPEFAARPPRIPGDPRTRAALGYLSANCGHCHNEQSPLATVRFPLLMTAYASPVHVQQAIEALITRTTKWDLPETPSGTTLLIRPGAPERSALLARMRSRRPSSQMPPLGTVVPDREALDLIAQWITDLARRDHSAN